MKFLTAECMLDLLVGSEELKVSLLLGLDQHYLEKVIALQFMPVPGLFKVQIHLLNGMNLISKHLSSQSCCSIKNNICATKRQKTWGQ